MSDTLEIEKLQEVLDKLRDKLSDLQFERQEASIAKNAAEVDKLTGLIKDQYVLISEQNKKLKELTKSQENLEKSVKKLAESVIKTIAGVDDFRQAIASTEFSFNNFTKSTTGLATGATEATGGLFALAAESLGANRAATAFKIGTAGASKAVEIFADQAIKQADNLIQAFDFIASVGGATRLTSIEIEELGSNAGFSGEALKFFGKLTKDQGSNLIAFGGNVSDGTRAFSEFIDVGENQLKVYSRLGISQNQLAEYQAFYADNLLRNGVSIDRGSKGMESLRKSSLEYRDILLALSSVTGQTLEQQQRAMDLAAADELFVAKQSQLDLERRAILTEANKLEEGQRKEELLARAEEIQNRIEFNKILATRLSEEQVGTQKATAVREMIASDGLALTESSVVLEMLFSSLGESARDLFQDFANASSEEDFLRAITHIESTLYSSVDAQVLRLGQSATAFGDASREIQNVFGLDVKDMAETAKRRGKTEEQINEEIFETLRLIRAERENAEREAKGQTPLPGGIPSDPVAEARAQAEAAGRALREKESQFYTNLIEKTFPAFTTALEGLTTTIQNASPGTVVGASTGLAVAGSVLTGALALLGAGSLRSVFKRPGPGPGPAPAASSGMTTSQRAQYQTLRSQNVPASQALQQATGRNPLNVRPSSVVRSPSTFTRLVQAVGKKYGSSAALKLAAQAGLMAVPGPGWILALINLGFNASLAWGIYQIWKEISGSAEDTSEDTITENAIPIAGMSAATNELAQSLAQLTGTDTEVGTIPTLTNSFDDLISTTDMLIEAFGSLRTSINSNNVSTASTTPRSFDSGTSSANMQTASTTPRSFDSGTNISEQESKDFIIGNEGTRYEPYKDTLGNWTVGVGHLIGNDLPPEMNRRFSNQEVMDLFDSDYRHHRNAAQGIPGFNKMDGLGQTALTDLTFNMGPSWINGWPNLANQLGEGDIPSAAENLRNSRWYDQVGNRGPRVANMLEDSTMISAAQGGIASGPETGYLGKLHGTELIQPINSDSVLSKLATTPESTSDVNINSNEIQTRMSEMYRSNMMLVETLNSKLDSMISKLEDGNYIQERILSNTV